MNPQFFAKMPRTFQPVSYRVFRKLETDELLWLTSFDELDQATRFVESLTIHWPGNYSVVDSTPTAAIDVNA